MAVTIEYTDYASAMLTVKVTRAEIQPEIDKTLKNYRQRYNAHGFRPGKAPMSLITRMFGAEARVQVINSMVADRLFDYLKTENIDTLGQPEALADLERVPDLEKDEELSFTFEVALAPKVEVELSKADELPYYCIEATDEDLTQQIEQMKAQYGKDIQVEQAEDNDLIRGVIAELEGGEVKEGGLRNEKAILLPRYIKSEEVRNRFVGAERNSVVVLDPMEAYEGNEAEVASFLNIKKEEVATLATGREFSFEIQSISRHVPAELDEEFFVRAFGEDSPVRSEQALREELRRNFSEQFASESDRRLFVDLRRKVIEKAGEVKYAEDFLKRALQKENPEASKAENFEADFAKMLQDVTFSIYRNKFLSKHNVKIGEEDMLEQARQMARSLFAQYGMSSAPAELVDNYATNLLKDEKSRDNIINAALDHRITAILKDTVTLKQQVVTPEEYSNLFAQQG